MFTSSSTAAKKPEAPKTEAPKSNSTPKVQTAKATPSTPAFHRDSFQPAPAIANKAKLPQTAPVKAAQQVGTTTPTIDTIVEKLKAGDTSNETRAMIHDYFAPLNMADSKAAMDRIRTEGLMSQFIDAAARDASGNAVTPQVKTALTTLFNTGRLDVYAETISNTAITVGDFGSGTLQYNPGTNGVELDATTLNDLITSDPQNAPNVLAHELFHAFSNAHGGDGYSALDEGFGIAAREYAFSNGDYSLAEMVYGTKNFYRDYRNEPDYTFGDFSTADPKLRELMNAFASRDSSHLAWNNPTQLESEYQKFFEPIPRDQPWNDWLAAVGQATADMLEARRQNAVPRPGHPVPV